MSSETNEQTPLLKGTGGSPDPAPPAPSPRSAWSDARVDSARGKHDMLYADEARSCCEPGSMLGQKRFERLVDYVTHLQDKETERVCQYETATLGTWRAFLYTAGTVWKTTQIWEVARNLLTLSAVTALITFFLTVTPESLDASVFGVIANFLKVFVAFLLGFYITSSMARWMDTVEGFLVLFNSSRNMIMQLHALGVPARWIQQCARYSILSAKFLSSDLNNLGGDGEKDDGPGDAGDALSPADEEAAQKKETVDKFFGEELLKEDEAQTLRQVSDHATLMWVWVALILGRMAQDGDIPPMASPVYGRLMSLTQDAQQGIRTVYAAMMVQMPFVYVHMLALLVHTNNIFCAVSFGCTLGQSIASMLARFGISLYAHKSGTVAGIDRDVPGSVKDQFREEGSVQTDLQTILMSFITSLFAPLLYQAALQIGLALAQPFNTQVGAIPVQRLIKSLKRDLGNVQMMADNPPGFKKPFFNYKPEEQSYVSSPLRTGFSGPVRSYRLGK